MDKNIPEEDVRQVLGQLMHPEINYSLIDLGMIKDIVIRSDRVTLTLNLPLMEIPIKDDLVNSIKEALLRLSPGVEVGVNLSQMSQEEKAKFMAMAQRGWRF